MLPRSLLEIEIVDRVIASVYRLIGMWEELREMKADMVTIFGRWSSFMYYHSHLP